MSLWSMVALQDGESINYSKHDYGLIEILNNISTLGATGLVFWGLIGEFRHFPWNGPNALFGFWSKMTPDEILSEMSKNTDQKNRAKKRIKP